MSLVWERAPYTAGTLLTFLALADWSNDEGFCWPSIAKIASKTRLERRSIQYIIRQLKKDNMIEIEEGRGRGHQHRFQIKVQNLRLLPSLMRDESDDEKVQQSSPLPEIKGAINDIEKAQLEAQKVQSRTEKVQPIAPDPLEEPLDKPLIEPPYVGLTFLTALATFKNHRKQIKRPLTPDGLRLLYKKLSTWPESVATQALEDAVINRWQGVFEPKGFRNGTYEKNGAGGEYQTLAQRGRAAGFDGLLSVVDELRASSSGGADEVIRRKPLAS